MPGQLMLHCDADGVPREQVDAIEAPAPKGRWNPISHGTFLGIVEDRLASIGYDIAQSKFGVTKDGASLFGAYTLNGKKSKALGNAVSMAVGVRNSTDKTFSAGVSIGSHVFVCDNMAFVGDRVIRRRHTTNIEEDLASKIDEAFGGAVDEFDLLAKDYANWKKQDLLGEFSEDPDVLNHWVYGLAVEAAKVYDVMPFADIPKVLDCWENTGYKAFKPRTTWSLYNAFTTPMKEKFKGNPFLQIPRTIALNQMFRDTFGTVVQPPSDGDVDPGEAEDN